MTYGLGAGGALGVALETSAAPGTWVAPAVSVPITNETLTYTEERYYSTAIRQQTVANDVRQGYYHIQGDVSMEVDTRYLPYFLHGSRWGVVKTGSVAPFTYTFTPSSTATVPSSNRTLSITVLKNDQVFAYSGCQVTQMSFTITNGILMCTLSVIGTTDNASEAFTPSFASPPRILSAPCHQITLIDGATATGTITTTPVLNFDGFTATINDNGTVQNRINASRAAAFVSYGITDLQATSSLDFLDKTEYGKYLSTARKSLQLLSTGNTSGVTAGHDIFQLDYFDCVYDVYNVELGSWDSLIMAQTTLRGVASGGTNPPGDIVITTDSAITPA